MKPPLLITVWFKNRASYNRACHVLAGFNEVHGDERDMVLRFPVAEIENTGERFLVDSGETYAELRGVKAFIAGKR